MPKVLAVDDERIKSGVKSMAFDPTAFLLFGALVIGVLSLSCCILVWACNKDRRERAEGTATW